MLMVRNNNYVSDGYALIKAELEPKSWKKRPLSDQQPDLARYIKQTIDYREFLALGEIEQRAKRPELMDKPVTIFHGTQREIVIQQKYFNMFKGSGYRFTIPVTPYTHNPIIVWKENELIGIIMPIRN